VKLPSFGATGFAPSIEISLLVVAFLNLLLQGACSRLAPGRLSQAERRESTNRFEEVIQGVGGSEVWIKAARRAGAPREVVAASPVFDAVLAAFNQEAHRQGLEVQVSETGAQNRWRAAEIHLLHRRELIGRWRFREVGQLRHAAIIIDDLGSDLGAARKLLELPCPLTFSVLPHLRYSVEIADQAHRSGREVMLHLPMQPEPGSSVATGPGEIRIGTSSEEVASIIERDLDSVPYSAGVNNHMGSRATANPALMADVMKVLAERRLFFVDSRTTADSVALDLARRQGIPAFYRSVFLDDTETVDYSLGQLRELRRVVEAQGAALAIGHPYPTTLAALAQFFPEFERDGIQLVPASQLVRLPEVARLSPPRRTDSSRAP
jgi:polysaccharide deacetylase 2 family uncharacterized protein YibQ